MRSAIDSFLPARVGDRSWPNIPARKFRAYSRRQRRKIRGRQILPSPDGSPLRADPGPKYPSGRSDRQASKRPLQRSEAPANPVAPQGYIGPGARAKGRSAEMTTDRLSMKSELFAPRRGLAQAASGSLPEASALNRLTIRLRAA